MGLTRAFLLAGFLLAAIAPAPAPAAAPALTAVPRQDEDARLLALLNSFARAQEALDPLGAWRGATTAIRRRSSGCSAMNWRQHSAPSCAAN